VISNPTEEIQHFWDLVSENGCTYLCGQLERGVLKKTLHLQLFLKFKTNKRFNNLRKLFKKHKSHLELSRNVRASIKYCMKEETRV
jgi:Putative viral replication protein